MNNLDASLIKNTQIFERLNLQFRVEMFNALNRSQFNGPETNPTSGNFGRITSAANLPRAVQLALRLRCKFSFSPELLPGQLRARSLAIAVLCA